MKKNFLKTGIMLLAGLVPGSVFASTFNHGLFDPSDNLTVATGKAFTALGPVFYTVAIVMIVYGAFMLFLSTGDPKKVGKAKEIIYYTLIAVALVVAANLLLNLMGANTI